MLLEALVACAGVTLCALATSMGLNLRVAWQSLRQPPEASVSISRAG